MPRKIGLEYELIGLRADGSHLRRKDIVTLWRYFQNQGWKPKIDQYTKKIVGVYKKTSEGLLVIDNDGGPPLIEVGWPPYKDLHTGRKKIKEIVKLINKHFKNKYRLVGYGCAPFTDPKSVELCPKAYYPVVIHSAITNTWTVWQRFYMVGALQVGLSGKLKELVRAQNLFLELTGILTALSANTSIFKGKIQKYKEMRQFFYDDLAKNFCPAWKNNFGIPKKPYNSWQEYFFAILKRPARILAIQGKLYEVTDKRRLYDILIKGDKIRVRELMHKKEECKYLKPEDFTLLAVFFWPESRLKFQFKKSAKMKEFTEALQSSPEKFDKYLEKNLSNYYLEVRPCAMQQPDNLLVMPAFMLGIMENMAKAEKIIEKQSWEFWRKMRNVSYKKGMQTKVNGVDVKKFLLPLYKIAWEGLKKRGKGEEVYLKPLLKRIQSKKTPADIAEEVFKTKNKKEFLDFLTITTDKI